jgi:hypothetical protein
MRMLVLLLLSGAAVAQDLPPNRWTELARDPDGARRGSPLRYSAPAGRFFLWGFMNSDYDLLQEQPLMIVPEYDMVAFDPAARRWENHLPPQRERQWSRRLPLSYVPRTYAGITTGSERTVMRETSDDRGAVPRPDLNVVFDQVVAVGATLYYFTGGLTAAYDTAGRRWTDLRPRRSPPPVLGGSLAHDPLHEEILLAGGAHVAEPGPDGQPRGYATPWVYRIRENEWQPLAASPAPPPRMNSRAVTDTRNNAIILFGGDAQRRYLADTWIYDLKTRAWKESKAPGPPARAGHFTVYDPETGLVLIGGGYNRQDLTDMWAYDPAADRWTRAAGEVPTGFYLSADIAPEKRLLVLATANKTPGDTTACNVLFPVRTTYGYRIERQGLLGAPATGQQAAIPKRPPEETAGGTPDSARAAAHAATLKGLPVNRWVLLEKPGRAAPTRTWGAATFDNKRGQILYWGGGHCGYEGSDVDAYDVASHTWVPEPEPPSYTERLWNHGVRPAGVTFDGEPWMDHGRKIYAYDPAGDRLVMARAIRFTTGYDPEWLRAFPTRDNTAPDALVSRPSSFVRYATFTWDPRTKKWSMIGPAPAGLDTLVSTPHGVMGVPVNWPGRLNDAGYQRPWRPSDPPEDNAVWLLRGAKWERLGKPGDPTPQNLYEMSSLVYDSKRNRLLLHGAGVGRVELWAFSIDAKRWENLNPKVDGAPPPCMREAVYIPAYDVMFTYGTRGWAYLPAENAWRALAIPEPGPRTGQNRAMVYDEARDIVLLVLGAGGDDGRASVYALRYRN